MLRINTFFNRIIKKKGISFRRLDKKIKLIGEFFT